MSIKNSHDDIKSLQIDKLKFCNTLEEVEDSSKIIVEDMSQVLKMDTETETMKPTDLCLQGSNHLISSITSSLADTPGDSGVLCLDSETSEPTSQALMYHSLIGAEELTCDSQCDPTPIFMQELSQSTSNSPLARSDVINNHRNCPADEIVPELLVETNNKSPVYENLPDVVLKALESEKVIAKDQISPRSCEPKKSLSEDIVFRRRCRKKSQSGPSSQKKRVSFHEDILNNTRTDNIHIERGFVSYKPDSGYCDRFKQRNNILCDRFSWCASGDRGPKYAADVAQQTMSDILTYGDPKNDKSGVFEYCQAYEQDGDENNHYQNKDKDNNNIPDSKKLYGCESNSSDSNFSCDSETSSSDSSSSTSNKTSTPPANRKCDKTQKSYSYDGFNNSGHVAFMRKTYFSEADIDQSHDRTKKPLEVSQSPVVKSVLKKKRYITTNVVEEKRQNSKVLNILDTNIILDSLKNFYKNFNFNLTPEKGLPETCPELNQVVEALPTDVNQNKKLSKSLDSGFQNGDEDDFVEINLNESSAKSFKEPVTGIPINNKLDGNLSKESSPRHKLTLNMKSEQNTPNKADAFPPVNKYVVNCESTVYEHKGVSYSYIHDTFQTAFDTPKQSFVPLPESEPKTESTTNSNKSVCEKMETESSSVTSTPRRQINKRIQEETDQKNGITKHLSSPKKQNINRYNRKSASTAPKSSEELTQTSSDNCSNTDNSIVKGIDDFEFYDSSANQKLMSNKSALLNRYLKNVCQKKDLELKIKNNKFYQNKLRLEKGFPSIIYPWNAVSKTFHISAVRVSRLIDREITENKRLSVRLLTANEPSYLDSFEDNVAIECSEKLRLKIFSFPSETLNRMMKVQSPYSLEDGSWIPLLVFITDYALYVAGVKPGGTEYDILCRLPHNELDAIAVGPEAQYIQIVDIAGNIACSVVTAETSLGTRLASSLEWNARTSPLRPAKAPAVLPLDYRQLAAAVARQRHEKKIPYVLFYGRACTGDDSERAAEPPGAFPAPLEGYLMCRTDTKKKFEPCYFLLRAGVLHWGPHTPDGSPLPNSVTLRSVVGVRRRLDRSRPHCFEIALNDSRLVLAAPDDHSASCWLQSLLLHAAQALEEKDGTKKLDGRRRGPPAACTVLVTQNEVMSVRETMEPAFIVGAAPYLRDRGSDALLKEYIEEMRSDVDILACESIKNLTAFKIPDSDENWCCLEWSVCEARERGAVLALVFVSSAELERFIAAVERAFAVLTSEPFPLSVVDGATYAVSAAHAHYDAAWAHMLPAQH
ncbi:Pleckstrin homology domain-containing family M member 2 [Eumeta japonica]|uniref:Pleckstrin homology domain-containing family M member 2 n=1 Tax=Eumeta variegata TaxID=151549 RepID=A0A4C2A1B5_EUMVA|nr:Pleckstrin homology domain-containing family M member 2 [Eumeta japonica]